MEADQKTLFKAQIIFWMLGATDGHAKNFSIRLAPGGRFRLTPLYDVASAQPGFNARQIRKNQMKLAMSVGAKRHCVVDTIAPRHFLQTAEQCGLPRQFAEKIIEELRDAGAAEIDRTLRHLPEGFPEAIAATVAEAAKRRLAQFAPAGD